MTRIHKTFCLSDGQLARLADIDPASRQHDLGRLMYAHLYREKCREKHVAILHHDADIAMQRHWQANRAEYVAEALATYARAVGVAEDRRAA